MSSALAFGLRPPRVLLTKIGLDGHDRGIRLVATYLRDAGMEVVYTGPWQEIPAIVKAALEEDVDVIGISSLATDHLLIPKLMTALHQAQLHHVKVIVGGIVPTPEEAELLRSGVDAVLHPGAQRSEIVTVVTRLVGEGRELAKGHQQ